MVSKIGSALVLFSFLMALTLGVAFATDTETTQTTPTAQFVKSIMPVSLKIDVYDTNLNGLLLPGVQVVGLDAIGNSFESITDSNGAVVLRGQPGTWQFSFTKGGYETLNLNFNVTETQEAAAYLQRIAQPKLQTTPQTNTQTQSQVILTLYVLDGGLNGGLLPGVDVTVWDAAGNTIGGVTDSKGSVILTGQPGTWQFILAKEGYETQKLAYTITKSEPAATYLQRIAQSIP